jgi:hypothetical protein
MAYRKGLWKDNCSICGVERTFGYDGNLYRFRSRGRRCNSCARKGKKRTEEQKLRISEGTKIAMMRPEVKQSLLTAMAKPEVKEKLRNSFLKQVKATGTNVPYNKTACKFFDSLNEFMAWKGVHAENRGEFCVGGFWVDYYEPNENLVIEWDEKHHKLPSRKKKDEYRQRYIIDKLGCEFYRIDEETLEFKRIV